jgi:hypothetical protein
VAGPEPERQLVRKASPVAAAAIPISFLIGAALGGWTVGLSAALGVGIIFANFVAHGLSLAWASRISLPVLFGVGLGGFIVRLAIIFAIMAILNGFGWFSPKAFMAAAVPGTIALLVFEMRQLSGRFSADLWLFKETA